MKRFVIALVCVFSLGTGFSQDFVKGGNYITVGYGLDPWGHPGVGNAFGTYKKSTIGPIMLSYEHGVTDVLGIGRIGAGGAVAQSWYTQKYSLGGIEDVYRRSRLSIFVRATYHFEFDIPKMDVYAGVGGGVHIFTDKDIYYSPFHSQADSDGYVTSSSTHFGGGHYVFAGIRYYFTPSFGVYAEAGHGLNALNGGMVFAF